MAVQVEHDKRKHEILEKALDLFIEEGYEDVTFQKIADRCGITRTTLYIYFKNKREIFRWSIKQLTAALEQELVAVIADASRPAPECLKAVCATILDACEKNGQLFHVLLLYLMQLQKSGVQPEERVKRRVIRLEHLLSTVVIRGQRSGEFKSMPVKEINDLLYALMESAIFRLAVLGKTELTESRAIINATIDGLCIAGEGTGR